MERFKVLAKTGHIALLQVRFDNEIELKRFCDKLPTVTHVAQQRGVTVLSADDDDEALGYTPHQGAALAACLIAPDCQESM